MADGQKAKFSWVLIVCVALGIIASVLVENQNLFGIASSTTRFIAGIVAGIAVALVALRIAHVAMKQRA